MIKIVRVWAGLLVFAVLPGCTGSPPKAAATPAPATSPAHEPSSTELAPVPGPIPTPALPSGNPWRIDFVGSMPDWRFYDMTATGPRDAWAVGRESGSLEGAPFLVRFDGVSWREQELPADIRSLTDHYVRVAASGPDDAWLFARSNDGRRAFHWNGATWREEPLPPASEDGYGLAVVALGPRDAWAVDGTRSALRWDGRSWRRVRLPAVANSISAVSPGDIWAVGSKAPGPGQPRYPQMAGMHWDGRSWRLVPMPTFRFPDPVPSLAFAVLDSVVALAPDDVWASGKHDYDAHGESDDEPEPESVLLHWDGDRWRRVASPASEDCCLWMISDGAGGLFLKGDLDEYSGWRRTGRSFTPVEQVPYVFGSEDSSLIVGSMAAAPGTGPLWMAGYADAGRYGERPVIVRYR
ncbi:hypothetical protein AB0B45_43460 [Nonomuraea sp. NPDC049152]|uniref:WD40/YVTN/BNR-like repeat-containing protein n=1 Tax=Nonomuraea sp. NPDC049152 TaxID=3154350 RepID=UPI00340AC717